MNYRVCVQFARLSASECRDLPNLIYCNNNNSNAYTHTLSREFKAIRCIFSWQSNNNINTFYDKVKHCICTLLQVRATLKTYVNEGDFCGNVYVKSSFRVFFAAKELPTLSVIQNMYCSSEKRCDGFNGQQLPFLF